MSTTSGWVASRAWSGAFAPAAAQTLALAVARAVLIAVRTLSTSPASRAMARERVGSEATGPNTAGSARTAARSEQVSPPNASVNARSRSTFAGSCRASCGRHGASASLNATSSPAVRTVEVNSTPPA